MDIANVSLKGSESLLKRLYKAGQNPYTRLDNSFAKGAVMMQNAIRQRTPTESGGLFHSINVRKRRDSHYSIGSYSKYAVPVEYGTGFAGDNKVKHGVFAGAEPHYNFTNGFKDAKKEVVEEIKQSFKEMIE